MSGSGGDAARELALEYARARHLPMYFESRREILVWFMHALLKDAEQRQISLADEAGEMLHFAISFAFFATLCRIEEPQRMRGEFGAAYAAAIKGRLPVLVDNVLRGYGAALQTLEQGPSNDNRRH